MSSSPLRPSLVPRALGRLLMLALLALAGSGCLGWPSALDAASAFGGASSSRPVTGAPLGEITRVEPQGPGAVFETVEEAALDALAYCYLESRRVVSSRRPMRGGTVRPTDGGFTYDEPQAERSGALRKLRYRMRPTDVAHFRHYPSLAQVPLARRALRREATEMVAHRDRGHRPLYVLSSARYIQVTAGADAEQEILARVEPYQRRGTTDLALRMAVDGPMAADQPLALQPAPEGSPAR